MSKSAESLVFVAVLVAFVASASHLSAGDDLTIHNAFDTLSCLVLGEKSWAAHRVACGQSVTG